MGRASIGRCLAGRPLVLSCSILLASAGCGPRDAPLPTATQAREAVQVALDGWKNGRDPESLKTANPPVSPVDSDWKAGKKLVDFAIGAEETVQGTKAFSVKLTLAPNEVKDTRYMVLGQNPFQIYREEDFQRMLNMENDPASDPKNRSQRPGSRR
jgi:hypothetical protein